MQEDSSSPIRGAEIKAWRQKMSQSRLWLAEACAVSERTVEAWEQELRNPSGPALLLLKSLMKEYKNTGKTE